MSILQNIDLKPYNTFGVSAVCDYFFRLENAEQLADVGAFLQENPMPFLFLGAGSNLLFVKDFHGLIIQNALQGKREISRDENCVVVDAESGEIWEDFVDYCVENGWGGVENLANIPGTVGASAVQNVGAYGVEAKEAILEVFAQDILTGEKRTFSNAECRFGYRSSIFKETENRNLFITKVRYKLDLQPKIRSFYGAIEQELANKNIAQPNIADIRDAVVSIRKSKLPDVKILGSAGSFFKNPIVDDVFAAALQKEYPEIPFYPLENERTKLAAGWLIEKCGLKGFRKGDAGVHEKQALVLVNYGNAAGKEIFELSKEVQKAVFERFGVVLERETIVVGE